MSLCTFLHCTLQISPPLSSTVNVSRFQRVLLVPLHWPGLCTDGRGARHRKSELRGHVLSKFVNVCVCVSHYKSRVAAQQSTKIIESQGPCQVLMLWKWYVPQHNLRQIHRVPNDIQSSTMKVYCSALDLLKKCTTKSDPGGMLCTSLYKSMSCPIRVLYMSMRLNV